MTLFLGGYWKRNFDFDILGEVGGILVLERKKLSSKMGDRRFRGLEAVITLCLRRRCL